MIIDVHGTKKADQANPAQPYAFADEPKRTRTPLIVSAMIGVVVAYVQSLFLSAKAAVKDPDYWPENHAGGEPDTNPTIDEGETEEAEPTEEEEPEPVQSVGIPKMFPMQMEVPDSVFLPIQSPVAPLVVQPIVLWPANDWANGFSYVKPSNQKSAWKPVAGATTELPPTTQTQQPPAGTDPDDADDDGDTNRAPRISGPVYLLDVAVCATLVIMLEQLLRNAHDPDGDAMAVTNITASSGTVAYEGGRWYYEPEPYRLGPVTLSYKITDGKAWVDQTALFSVVTPAPIHGTDGDDILWGGSCGDEIYGHDGNDIIDGRDGNDIIYGGNGNDHILGGRGNDILYGGAGHDVIFGGAGNDQIYGGSGNDRLFGDEGDDVIFGEDGDDLIFGGAGNDYLSGGRGNDTIYGGIGNDVIDGDEGDDFLYGEDGNDIIRGGAGNDHIEGGAGNDILFDGEGADTVLGGAGDDYFIVAMDGDDDHFDGGEGFDTLDFSDATDGIVIDLVNGQATSLEIGNDTITGFENIIGGAGDDHFIIGDQPVTLSGGEGENVFEFTAPPSPASSEPILHKIIDFKKGDVIKMSKYKIFDEVFDELEDEFERIYGREIDDDEVTIRYRHEEYGQEDRTVIEADFNNDNIFETSIILQGRHVLVIMEAS
jgi:Ca2+-binding RTX toxin-like protein